MATVTYYVVLPSIRDADGEFLAEAADRRARLLRCVARVPQTERKAGDIGFSRTGDPELGEFDDATTLSQFGAVPDDLAGFTIIS